jgi:hypothetical protein
MRVSAVDIQGTALMMRRINMEYCRMYQNDGKIKGVAVELSMAECLVVMDALKDYSGAQDLLNGLKKACGGADEQEE